jgi:hypothetical protein
MFPIIGFLTRQILGVVGFQIETMFFSLVEIFINRKRCHLQIVNLEKLIFANKNWPNDPRIGCKSPSNLLEFLERDVNLEVELEEFEGELKWMKLLKCKISINKILFIVKNLFVTMFAFFHW